MIERLVESHANEATIARQRLQIQENGRRLAGIRLWCILIVAVTSLVTVALAYDAAHSWSKAKASRLMQAEDDRAAREWRFGAHFDPVGAGWFIEFTPCTRFKLLYHNGRPSVQVFPNEDKRTHRCIS